MFFTNLTRREKRIFYLTIAVIAFSLAYNFIIEPPSAKWSQLNQQIVKKEIELKRNIIYLQQKDRIKQGYGKYADYIRRSGSDEEEMAILLNTVEQQARSSGIHIANIRPKPIQTLGLYNKYILEMNCEAQMERYIEFIYNLQKSAQLIRVEKIKLTSQGKGNPLLNARLVITKVLIAD